MRDVSSVFGGAHGSVLGARCSVLGGGRQTSAVETLRQAQPRPMWMCKEGFVRSLMRAGAYALCATRAA